MGMQAATNYPEGLFTPEECNSANVSERDAKVAFLKKLIDHVSGTLGVPIDCNPSKIVAGQEPEKTNLFLHALYAASTE
jgi:TRAF3-interacting protein 1